MNESLQKQGHFGGVQRGRRCGKLCGNLNDGNASESALNPANDDERHNYTCILLLRHNLTV